jgi:hypothetical protein
VDTNCWIAYLGGLAGPDTERLDAALADGSVVMAPPVVAELLTDPMLPPGDERELLTIPMIEISPGYWTRAGCAPCCGNAAIVPSSWTH